jgi:hypothetical protein
MSRRSGILVNGCVAAPIRQRALTFQAIYSDYLRRFGPEVGPEAEWFGKRRRSLTEAIAYAAKSELPSRHAQGMGRLVVHEHQRRVGKHRLARLAEILAAEEKAIAAARSFPVLLRIIESAAAQVNGIGALTCYDVAHRIGSYKGISPGAVYLHTGTLDGARALGLARGGGKLAVSALPSPLNRLSPAQAEDVLCIYKADLKRLARRSHKVQ